MAGAGACAPGRLVRPSLPGATGREEKGVDVFLICGIGESAGIVEHPAFLNKPRTVAPVRGFFFVENFSGDSESGASACRRWCSTRERERVLFSAVLKLF